MTKVTEYLSQPIPIRKHLLTYFDVQDKLIILDIGACEGLDSIKYSKLFPNATIYAFEPLPTNVQSFTNYLSQYNVQNVKIIQEALSDAIGSADFYVSSGHPDNIERSKDWDYGNKSSSLLQPDRVKEYHSWLEFKEKIKVPTNTLANFLKEHQLDGVDVIHMDVQGAELKVLEGAENYLQQVKFIWMEVENTSLYADQPLKKDVEQFMRKHDFIKVLDTVSQVSGDQLYIHKNFIKKESRILQKVKGLLTKNKEQPSEVFAKLTYSQCGEDVIIKHLFNSLKIDRPSYIDVGAHHPQKINNTALLYEEGSRGINIEPDPQLFKHFPKFRQEDINLNIGIADSAGEMDLYIMSSPSLNTFSGSEAHRYVKEFGYKITNTKKIKVTTLPEVIKEFANGRFPEFLSLDVEGLDEQILKSITYDANAPIVICVETISFSNQRKGEKQTNIISFLKHLGYMVYADTYINTIFVKEEQWTKS